jgi:hypothetical protein
MATATLPPGSLQRMVRPQVDHTHFGKTNGLTLVTARRKTLPSSSSAGALTGGVHRTIRDSFVRDSDSSANKNTLQY